LETCPEKVYFKDRESRFLLVSRSHIAGLGRTRPSEVLGHTDFDFFTEEHAKQAFEDEQAIIRTGMPMLGKLEKEPRTNGRVTWALTTKLPLRNAAGEIIGTFGVSQDVTGKKEIEAELEKAHRDLVLASRIAGMAEVATGVLHNVGNVLNSLNVSASVISTGLRQSKVESLSRLSALLHDHQADLGAFLSSDPRGRKVPEFLTSLARHSVEERDQAVSRSWVSSSSISNSASRVTRKGCAATTLTPVNSRSRFAATRSSRKT
jgi:PAS domain S-box-containing protein